MITLMAWNIQAFGLNKLGVTAWDVNGSRAAHIVSTIQQVNPDILVVIEVRTGQNNGVGSLITDTSGGPGVRTLLNVLNPPLAPPIWAVVPPLVLNPNIGPWSDVAYSEGIAVYFRMNTLDFTGPYKWTANGAEPLAGPTPAMAYGGPWAGALPGTPGPGTMLNQNQLAGQPIFWHGNPAQQIFFPTLFSRNPWLTTFREKNTPDAGRVIKIFAVHFPPQPNRARQATARLADVTEVTAPLGISEVRAIVGDFNVNTLDDDQVDIFDQLTLNIAVDPNSATTNLYDLEFVDPTVVKPVGSAATTGAAPYYAYIRRTGLDTGIRLGLDTMLTAHSGGGTGVTNVVNRIVGVPGYYTVDMLHTIPWIIANLPPGGARKAHFNTLANFGHIGGTWGASDHLALAADI